MDSRHASRLCLPWIALAVIAMLSACVPTLAPEVARTPRIPGGEVLTVPFAVPDSVDVSDLDPADLGPDGRTLVTAYETIGRGAPIVMVHGIGGGSNRFQYRDNAPALANAGYRVFTPDLIGFGASSRPVGRSTQDLLVAQLESFLDDVVGEPAVLVANGLAGAYAIRLAVERPDLVHALTLIAPTGLERLRRPQDDARTSFFSLLEGPLGNLLYWALVDEDTQRFFLLDAYASDTSLTPEIVEAFDEELRVQNAQWIVFSFVSGNLDQDVTTLWPDVEQPALIVWGDDATTTPVTDAEAFLRAKPDAWFLSLSGARLLPNEERTDAFNDAVLAFLTRVGW